MTEIINSGALDQLDKNGEFHEISYSRMGGFGEEALARQLFESLKAKRVSLAIPRTANRFRCSLWCAP